MWYAFKTRNLYKTQFIKTLKRMKGRHCCISSKFRKKFLAITSASPFKSQRIRNKVLFLNTKPELRASENSLIRFTGKERELQ